FPPSDLEAENLDVTEQEDPHTVKATANLFKVESKTELLVVLSRPPPNLVFLFFFPDNCDMEEPFKRIFLPKVAELAAREPTVTFLTVFIDMEARAWEEWADTVEYFKTGSIVGQAFVVFKDG